MRLFIVLMTCTEGTKKTHVNWHFFFLRVFLIIFMFFFFFVLLLLLLLFWGTDVILKKCNVKEAKKTKNHRYIYMHIYLHIYIGICRCRR